MATTPARDSKFFSELKQLNEDFVKLIDETQKKSPYFDLTPTLNDYIRQFDDLNKQYPSSIPKLSLPFAPTLSSIPIFKPTITTTITTTTTTTTPSLPTSTLAPSLLPTPTTTTTNFTSLFSSTTQPFVFGAPAPAAPPPAAAPKEEDEPPPEPNVDIFQEPDAKHQIRCKLYERDNSAQVNLIGCGVLFVKQLENPTKLQVIVRQDPDLRRVLFNEIISPNIPFKKLSKAIQIIVPCANGPSKIYIAKLKEEQNADELFEVLNSIKSQPVA